MRQNDLKKVTFTQLSGGRLRCNQSPYDKISRFKVKAYRNARLNANRPPRHGNGNGPAKTGKQKTGQIAEANIFSGIYVRCPHCSEFHYVKPGIMQCKKCLGKFRAVSKI